MSAGLLPSPLAPIAVGHGVYGATAYAAPHVSVAHSAYGSPYGSPYGAAYGAAYGSPYGYSAPIVKSIAAPVYAAPVVKSIAAPLAYSSPVVKHVVPAATSYANTYKVSHA